MKCTLVSWPVVRTLRHLGKRQIFAQVDSGELLWVFNIATPGSSERCLRFWLEEIRQPERARMLASEEAITWIIGTDRARLRLSEVIDLLEMDWKTGVNIGRLMGSMTEGEGQGNRVTWVPREGLRAFLAERWIGRSAVTSVQGRMF